MKASLQLKLGQSLTMTPQLQQAIRLLQLSTLELQQEIQQALESNPLLETEDEQFESLESVKERQTRAESKGGEPEAPAEAAAVETSETMTQETMPDELPVDTTWDEVYTAAPNSGSGALMPDDETPFQGETSQGLYEHLEWQKNLTPFSDVDYAIATAIIDAVDERGYLTQTTEDILAAMGDPEIEPDEVEAVLKRVQHFDPVGVAARDVSDCLHIQLSQLQADTPYLEEAKLMVLEYLPLIAVRDFRTLMRKTKLKEAQLKDAVALIQTLDPRPGLSVGQKEDEYVTPDVSVSKKNGRWTVELNPHTQPKLNVNQRYAALAKGARNSVDGQFVRGHLQDAKWFIKSLESRNDTILRVCNEIVKKQQGFFEYGPEAMKALVLNDIAVELDMHESTISRVTSKKYMHTPRGIFELKYFFSSHVGTDDGGECSSTAIRALIRKLVDAENTKKPLSDNKMAQLLNEQGINVARRTIAKYREAMMIPPSNQRKSL